MNGFLNTLLMFYLFVTLTTIRCTPIHTRLRVANSTQNFVCTWVYVAIAEYMHMYTNDKHGHYTIC